MKCWLITTDDFVRVSRKRIINDELIACNIEDVRKMIINDALIACNIEEAHKAVVEFVKMYNTKKKGE